MTLIVIWVIRQLCTEKSIISRDLDGVEHIIATFRVNSHSDSDSLSHLMSCDSRDVKQGHVPTFSH